MVAVQVQRGDMPPVELPEWEKVPSAGAQSPFPALRSSSCTPSPSPSSLGNQSASEQQEEAEEESLQAEGGSEEGSPAGYDDDWETARQTAKVRQKQSSPKERPAPAKTSPSGKTASIQSCAAENS